MKKQFRSGVFLIFLVAILIAVALAITGKLHAVEVGRKLGEYTHIQAVVTDKKIVPGTGADHYSTVASVVEFEVDGVTYTIKDRVSSTSNPDRIGTEVEIACNPNDPNDCLFVKSEKKLVRATACVQRSVPFIRRWICGDVCNKCEAGK